MRSILLYFWLCSVQSIYAQSVPDQRTPTTKIADVLAKVPSANEKQHEANMRLIATLDVKGLQQLALMLKDPAGHDNTSVEYALSGFAYYVCDGKHEVAKTTAATAYLRALGATTIYRNKLFLINQLQIVGNDDIAGYLLKYLDDPQLSDPVIRVLVKINSPFTRRALLNSLYNSTGELKLQLVEALGEVKALDALPTLSSWAASEDKRLKKVVLYAISKIADPSSLDLLYKQAEKVSFNFDTVGTTGFFMNYLQNLYNKDFQTETDKGAWMVWNKSGNQKTKFAALELLTQTRGLSSVPLLAQAVKEQTRPYRVFALNLALRFVNNKEVANWVRLLKSAEPETKRDIIEMLGKTGNITALPALTEAMNDKNAEVSHAAITATSLLGGYRVQEVLVSKLKDADPATVKVIKFNLVMLKGLGLNINELADRLPAMSNTGVVAILEVLAAKSASSQVDKVLSFLKHDDSNVSNAAFTALPSVATQQTLPALYSLLAESGNAAHVKNIQSAIITANQQITDSSERIKNLQTAMKNLPDDKQYLFFDVFAKIGNAAALKTVMAAYAQGDANTKLAVVNSLANWSDLRAVETLYQVTLQYTKQADFDKVLDKYIEFVNKSKFTPEQRLLELRRAMEIAKTVSHRKAILKDVGRCSTLPGLLFAGKYLDAKIDREAAADAVMRIALSGNGSNWNGAVVKSIIKKAIPYVIGTDAAYQKKAMQQLLDELKSGDGFVSLFNGINLDGWKGLVGDPIKRVAMTAAEQKEKQVKADSIMHQGWEARDGLLIFKGKGQNLCTVKKFGDFEMYIDWKITSEGDAGVYLRGSPQVQIWDTSRVKVGAQVGSGGLYNNKIHPAIPLVVADNAIGEWNNFYIKMVGEKVTVFLNGKKVVDEIVLENYWDRKMPIFPFEQLELQAHGTYVAYRDIYLRELASHSEKFSLSEEEKKEGYQVLFDGTNLDSWQGNLTDYKIEQGELVVRPTPNSKSGNLYTKEEYSDFIYRLEFKLTPGANNGIGLRAPLTGDAAYQGMEVQMLDDASPIYSDLKAYQYHGSVYGLIASKRGFLKPAGEWNYQEIKLQGNKITVTLNGMMIVNGDIGEAIKNGTLDKLEHPGANRKTGYIGFLGHGDVVSMKNIRIRKL